jgi:hypothetical protein
MSSPVIDKRPFDCPGAWTVKDFPSPESFSFHLTPAHAQDIDKALITIRNKGLKLDDIGHADFELPELADDLADIFEELQNGRGFVVLKGLPVDRYTKDELGMVLWGVGTHFGAGVAQNAQGDRLGDITFFNGSDAESRGAYRGRQELRPHTDFADIAGLMCVRQSKSGGESIIASALSIHNCISRNRPRYLEALYRGYQWSWRPGERFGDLPYTPHRVPVFASVNGVVSCRFIRYRVEAGADAAGAPLTELDRQALDYLEKVCYQPEFCLRFALRPGEMLFLNNYTIMHARTAFEDYEEPERRRHLLRLWLVAHKRRPILPEMELPVPRCRRPAIL